MLPSRDVLQVVHLILDYVEKDLSMLLP
jgi:hypothetical protein